MTNLIIILGLLLGLGGMYIHIRSQDRKTGQNEQKLEVAESVIDNVKKAKGAVFRLNDDIRRKLREKYNR
jgi:hypothetical protein